MSATVKQLGVFKSRILVFGGPYSNLQATRAMKSKAMELGISPDHVICTGDVVAYCAQPAETVKLIRDWGIHVVQGNCEHSLGNDEPDCGCGFAENSACDLASKEWFDYSRTRVHQDDKNWMKQLPYSISFEMQDKSFYCIHGSYSEQNEFVFASTSTEKKLQELHAVSSDIMIGGHCGLPFGERLSLDKAWLNAGVIGMPANDGESSTWYMLIEPENDSISVSWHSLSYDHNACKQAMEENNVSHTYQASIESGLWPNMDVLPEEERANQGKAQRPFRLTLPTEANSDLDTNIA